MRILVTGGCGFIGSAVIRYVARHTGHTATSFDKMTYASNEDALEGVGAQHRMLRGDVVDGRAVRDALAAVDPDAVMHLAAETHVDRSIDGPAAFIEANVVGTFTLLEAVREHWRGLDEDRRARFRFHHISTDEVFGALGPNDPPFTEKTPYDPRSPYSASKAASDHLVRAWHHTYGLPTFVTNTSNNYGPWQFPEKLIPLIISNALAGLPLPVYGKGSNQRDWLYVDDHAEALVLALERAEPGDTLAIGGRQPRSNLNVVHGICTALDAVRPDPEGPHARLIQFVADRPGHDFRYEIDPSRAEAKLGWRARHDFEAGLRKTVDWYAEHEAWGQAVRARRYRGERLGTAA